MDLGSESLAAIGQVQNRYPEFNVYRAFNAVPGTLTFSEKLSEPWMFYIVRKYLLFYIA